ncbi:zinc-binding dehydrogenase [Actinoalloteichus hymeniacidonis]|uniref:Zn-dependent oxidoreductase, NADPH:quinone reductase n=1 Tax=Actinoalloteichus hymeniacidonis TaxID=340345 RepID=A0AAC9MX94_9PSEU|nr:zinc-binding dehydrogenase [Actinoalloteichus hymeniacidonis]AOS62085.1 Zn-dependent oxidoreductase, NADPH:quinone reductase [Actinoalloteichus hymeniacidonis]MBB5909893.1 NADPH2:quinone reductase [Actinoalloteichus hymeniacidonis]
MYAIRLLEFGPAENLRYLQVPDPIPARGQVRIAVAAAGVHLIHTRLRTGSTVGPNTWTTPTTPGSQVAGVVDQVGPGVAESWLGQRVAANATGREGGYAELAIAEADSLHSLPAQLSAEAAVAMLGSGGTARGIIDFAEFTDEDVVLITSAAGGMGSLFVQAAVAAGATAVGIAGGAAKVQRVRTLGAEVAVDYLLDDWPQRVRAELAGREVTVVLDGTGGDIGRAALELLGVGGRMLLHGMASGAPTELSTADLANRSLTASWVLGPQLTRKAGSWERLSALALADAAEGRLTPTISGFPLSQAAEAHRALENRETVGAVVLTV